jgi:hypothetical protein
MTTKISKQGWEEAYYGKWLKAQEKTRKKVKWEFSNQEISQGWESLTITCQCSYCYEIDNCPTSCSLYKQNACGFGGGDGAFYDYTVEMRKPRTNWKRANKLVDQIVEAIKQDGIEWGYLKDER